MKGFVWGFPSSNKFWKNIWFFVGGRWGQSISFDLDGTRVTRKVPRYFCSPEAWNHTTPSFTDGELLNLAQAAIQPLEKRGKLYLFNEDKMIKAHLFPQIFFHRRRREARKIKAVVEASRKEVLRQKAAGIALPQGDSDESLPEDPPEGADEGILNETRGPEEETILAEDMLNPGDLDADEVAALMGGSGSSLRAKGKEKIGEPSGTQVSASERNEAGSSAVDESTAVPQGDERVQEPSNVVASEFPTPIEPTLIPSPAVRVDAGVHHHGTIAIAIGEVGPQPIDGTRIPPAQKCEYILLRIFVVLKQSFHNHACI
ncbi:hypothetical protein LWI29_030108 [Acer saccharum]|uniref:Uncharacterized protein n=1 Tax=Acer saccharum TaxID=4024 RepID=A0AA39RJP0_ACESA|nr:hypothetical protein LWI29_030108 [Acer saccharum]